MGIGKVFSLSFRRKPLNYLKINNLIGILIKGHRRERDATLVAIILTIVHGKNFKNHG